MTTIGHTFTALSVAAVAFPRGRNWAFWSRWLWVVAPAASLPDFPLPYWGHHRYEVSHSLFVNLALVALVFVCVAMLQRARPSWIEARYMLGVMAVAWLSHLGLDALYAHGDGVAILWPVSDAHLAMPVPWFETVRLPVVSAHNRGVFLTEFAVFGGLFLVALGLRFVTGVRARR